MKRTVLLAAATFHILLFIPQFSFCQEGLEIRARIWPYKSICELTNPPNITGHAIRHEKVGTMESTATGCGDLSQIQPRLVAICLTLGNKGKSMIEVLFNPAPSAAVFFNKGGQQIPAVARRGGDRPISGMFTTEATGSAFFIQVEPAKEIDILYLFQNAEVGDTIKLNKLDAVTIR